MLILDWVQALGLPCEAARLRLSSVKRFVFGERYYVEMDDGRIYQDNDLERVLTMMRDEFNLHNTTLLLKTGRDDHPEHAYALVQIASGSPTAKDPLGQRSQRVLQVLPMFSGVFSAASGVLPTPDIDAVVASVRDAITFYNLSGDWEQFKKDNL